MKTQLLQDIDENGSAARRLTPAPPVGAKGAAHPKPAPAVWRRPQAPGTPSSRYPFTGPFTAPFNAPQRATASSMRRASEPGRPPGERRMPFASPFPPAPAGDAGAASGAMAAGPDAAAAPRASDASFTAEMPPWLAERLREDAAARSEWRWRGAWTRRLLTSGVAAVLLALVGAGALWLYRETRDEGALTVVANVAPVDAAPAAGAGAVPSPSPALVPVLPRAAVTAPREAGMQGRSSATSAAISTAPGITDLSAFAPAPATRAAPVSAVPTASAASDSPAPSATRTERRADAATGRPSGRTAERTSSRPARTVAKAEPGTAAVTQDDDRPATRRRREETLMQCRVLGYDERTCIRRGCDMTRFGLACKG